MNDTKIEYVDKTWSPITGCTAVSAGCENCYARRMANRLRGRYGYPQDEPFKVTLHADRLDQPLYWRKPRRIFVCSMGDLFHKHVPSYFMNEVLVRCVRQSRHQFLLLTKRPERMLKCFSTMEKIHPNLWLGVSVENQETADERIPILLQIPAAVRFVSVEPMLGPVDINRDWHTPVIDWVICGAETGPGARPMDIQWAYSLGDQCVDADVPFFFKKDSNGNRVLHGQLWEQYPERSKS